MNLPEDFGAPPPGTNQPTSTPPLGGNPNSTRPKSRPDLRSVVVAMAAGLVVAVTVLAAGFPAIARSYAINSITALTPDIPPAPEESSLPEVPKSDDLGVRSLPLLSDEARAAWYTDPATALQAAAEAVFGSNYGEARQRAKTSLNRRPALDSIFNDVTGYFDFGSLGEFTSSSVAPLGEEHEQDILDLTGLLLLNYDFNDQEYALLAFSLTNDAARQFSTCDSKLALVHAISLSAFYSPPPMLWESAITACPNDPTPAVEQLRESLARFSNLLNMYGMRTTSDTYIDWRQLMKLADDTETRWPQVAGALVAAGDTYRKLAEALPQVGVGPFTISMLKDRALTAYSQAAKYTSMPRAITAMAMETAISDASAALDVIDQIKQDVIMSDSATAFESAWIAAQAGDFQRATRFQNKGLELSETNPQPILVPFGITLEGIWGYYNQEQIISSTGLTLPPGAQAVVLLDPGAGMGGSMVEDFSFVPTSRSTSYLTYYKSSYKQEDMQRLLNDYATLSSNTKTPDDSLQDLYRLYGDLDRAASVTESWIQASGRADAYERLGEIRFLQQRWQESSDASSRAVSEYSRYCGYGDMTGPEWALLRQAVAERQLGHPDMAKSILDSIQVRGTRCLPSDLEISLLRFYTQQEQAQVAYELQDYENALELANSAFQLRPKSRQFDMITSVPTRGAAEHLAGLSAFALGRYPEALDWANQALESDPYSPLYQEAVADAQRALGQASPTPAGDETEDATEGDEPAADTPESLIATYQAALELDPTLFSSWNNLGVLLAQQGDTDDAVEAFKQAVFALPDYSYAWFNLGVVTADQPGLRAFLLSEGALGKAASLDSQWKNRASTLVFDDEVYQSGLDISKPIPADWHLAQTVRYRPALITASLVGIITLRLGWEIGKNWFAGRWASGALRSWRTGKGLIAWLLGLRIAPLWTFLVSLVALVWLTGATTWKEYAAAGATSAALLGAHALAPRLATATAVPHNSHLPASLVTVLLTPFGLGFTPPPPLTEETEPNSRVQRSGPLILAALTAIFTIVAVATAVPTARTVAMAGVLLLSSALVPVSPLDGARLNLSRWADLVITGLLTATAVALALGWL